MGLRAQFRIKYYYYYYYYYCCCCCCCCCNDILKPVYYGIPRDLYTTSFVKLFRLKEVLTSKILATYVNCTHLFTLYSSNHECPVKGRFPFNPGIALDRFYCTLTQTTLAALGPNSAEQSCATFLR